MNNENKIENPVIKPVLVAKDFLTTSILLVVIVFLWIGFGVYKIFFVVEVDKPLRELAKPLSIQLDRKVLEDLEGRLQLKNVSLNEKDRIVIKSSSASVAGSPD
jgi:hypothetical protein